MGSAAQRYNRQLRLTLESRYGMCAALAPIFSMTLPSAERLLLMWRAWQNVARLGMEMRKGSRNQT